METRTIVLPYYYGGMRDRGNIAYLTSHPASPRWPPTSPPWPRLRRDRPLSRASPPIVGAGNSGRKPLGNRHNLSTRQRRTIAAEVAGYYPATYYQNAFPHSRSDAYIYHWATSRILSIQCPVNFTPFESL